MPPPASFLELPAVIDVGVILVTIERRHQGESHDGDTPAE
jgi:hypothetical protein